MRASALFLSALLCPVPAWPGDADCGWIYEGVGRPDLTAATPSPPPVEICRSRYLLTFDSETRLARWVMQRLDADALTGEAERRKSRFAPDPALPEAAQAALADYKGSGFDRGHLAPAADFKADQQAMDESFYLTNVAPQVGSGFNRHLWARLEAAVRARVRDGGEVYVVTGPVVIEGGETIGEGRVPVPTAFFKAVYDAETGETLAWLVPNRVHRGIPYSAFAIPLEDLETLTGLDFWPDAKP